MSLLLAPAVAILALAAATDLMGRRIPNGLVLALAAVALGRMVLAFDDGPLGTVLIEVLSDFAAALGVFALGAFAFQLNALGGGDVKLMAAATLWLGVGALWPFLFVTALAGGGLALAFLVLRALSVRLAEGLPYGVAIAAGGIVASLLPV